MGQAFNTVSTSQPMGTGGGQVVREREKGGKGCRGVCEEDRSREDKGGNGEGVGTWGVIRG